MFDAMSKELSIRVKGPFGKHGLRDVYKNFVDERKSTTAVLFQLSKAWSVLAAPYRFQTLRLSKSSSMIFRYAIAPMHARHFQHLILDDAPAAVQGAFLALLPALSLPSLRTITIGQTFVSQALGLGSRLADARMWYWNDASLVANFLVRLLSGVTTLHLALGSSINSYDFSLATPDLRVLHLQLNASAGEVQNLSEILKALQRLEELHITTVGSIQFQPITAKYDAATWPSLSALSYAGTIDPSFCAFASLFAASLGRLRIECTEDSDSDLDQRLFCKSHSLPHLRHLSLDASHFPHLETLLETVRMPNVPQIEVLTLSTREHLSYFNFSAGLEWLDNLAVLRSSNGEGLHTIEFFDPIYLPGIEEIFYLREWARTYSIRVELDPLTVLPNLIVLEVAAAREEPAITGDAGDLLISGVERTVDFIENWRRRAASTGDVVEFARLAEVLRAAELERAAMAT